MGSAWKETTARGAVSKESRTEPCRFKGMGNTLGLLGTRKTLGRCEQKDRRHLNDFIRGSAGRSRNGVHTPVFVTLRPGPVLTSGPPTCF